MKEIKELESVIKGGNRAMMFECFGTHFSAKIDDVELLSKAELMIPKLEAAIENWKTVREDVAPKAEELRKKRLEEKMGKLRKLFTPEEIKNFLGGDAQ